MSAPTCPRCRMRPRIRAVRWNRTYYKGYCFECARDVSREADLKLPQVQAVMEARSKPCVDCGVELPWEVMELDHVHGTKDFSLSRRHIRSRPLAEVVAEIAKCQCRCPNCHALRHYWATRPALVRPTRRLAS